VTSLAKVSGDRALQNPGRRIIIIIETNALTGPAQTGVGLRRVASLRLKSVGVRIRGGGGKKLEFGK